MEKARTAFKMLIREPTGKRPLGRPWCGWEKNILIDFEEIDANRINSVLDRYYRRVLVNAALNLRIPWVIELISEFVFCLLTE